MLTWSLYFMLILSFVFVFFWVGAGGVVGLLGFFCAGVFQFCKYDLFTYLLEIYVFMFVKLQGGKYKSFW